MALKIRLRPHERIIIGGALVTNGGTASELIIGNRAPILRERDIMSEEEANTPCRRIYFVVQLMYIDERKLADYHSSYWSLVRELVEAVPRTLFIINQVSENILQGNYYRALKEARKLIDFEEEVVNSVRASDGSV